MGRCSRPYKEGSWILGIIETLTYFSPYPHRRLGGGLHPWNRQHRLFAHCHRHIYKIEMRVGQNREESPTGTLYP